MKHIIEDIFRRKDRAKKIKPIELNLYNLSEELYNEFDRIGMIDRLKSVPQLGSIRVNNNISKSRYDYLILQIWLHKKAHDLVNTTLEYSYASTMHTYDLIPAVQFTDPHKKPTVEEFIQTFSIAYNVGHCYNTFLSSRAMIYALKKSNAIYNDFVSQFTDARIPELLRYLIDKDDYHHFHLINSILVLEQCEARLFSVKIAKELIFAYLDERMCSDKLRYVFNLFKRIRDLSITTFDLQLDHTPFRVNLTNDISLKLFLQEYLARYNDNRKAIQTVYSLTQLLSTFVYNEEKRTIKTYYIAKGIARKIIDGGINDYFTSLFSNADSPINKKPSSSLKIESNCLKLTFCQSEKNVAEAIFSKLDRMNHIRVAKYHRHDGRTTLVVSVNQSQKSNLYIQLRILRTSLSQLRKINGIKAHDIRYLIITKYFLTHVLDNRMIQINPTGEDNDEDICVYCVKGSKNKLQIINNHIKYYNEPAQRHEVEHMRDYMQNETKKDLSILVPASIVVFDTNNSKTDVEFDGFIIHPYRTTHQIVFLEAKVSREAGHAEKELRKKLKRLNWEISPADITLTGFDAHYMHSL